MNPLADVCLVAAPYESALERRIQERERASFEMGRAEGEKALGAQLVQQRSDLLSLQNGVLNSLRQSVAHTVRETETALIGLALEVAQKLIAGLPVSAELVEASVKEALAQVQETNEFVVALHPEDLELLQRVNSPLLLNAVAGEKMQFESSPEIGRGGCVVRTRFGTVDGRREIKFELLKKSLQD